MGNLVRRVLAFVLGMVFTVSLAAGSVAGGAYWAYKTVKPLTAVTDKDSGLGDLREQTVEDLVALLQSAAAEPDKYTLARLADEYNIDFVKLLDKVGVKVDADKNKANWNALMGVSLFNLKDGIEPFLKSIPVRALYNFISEEQLDNLLSREAQDKLGDYTVYELISKEEGETDVGAIKAVRTLSIGSLLPQFFEEKYDAVTHRSEYVLKDDCKIRVLEVFGNVSLGVISNMLAPGADFMTELLEGSLSSVAEMPIEDIIYDIAATISEDIGKEVKKYAAVLNGAKISQLFTRNADGGYSFTYESVVKDLKIGCIFGLTDKLGDGVWTNKNGEPVPDVLQELCNIDLGAIFDNDGTLDMINQLIGGVNVGMILDACKVEVGTPALDMIRKIEIGKLLEGQTDKFDVNKFLQSLVSNVRESVGDVTLSEIIGVTTGNAFVDKLLSFKVSDFVLDEYSVKNILNALKSGFGDVCLGDVLNVTKGEGGEWNITGTAFEKLEFMKPLFDLSINNIINVVDEIASNNGKVTASAIVETIIPELKLGDIFVAIPGISKDEATGNYVITAGNISKVLPSGIGALLDMRVYQIVDGIENNNSQFDLYTILDNVKFGDFVSFADDLLNKGEKEYVYDEKSEKYVWKNDAASSTTKFMNVSVAEMVNDAFKNKFEKTLSTPVIAVTEFAAEMGKWVSRVSGLDKTLTEIDSQLDSLCGIVSGIFTPESTLKKATVADDVEAGVIVDGVRIILDTVNSFKTSSGKKIIPNAVYSAVDGIDEIIGGIKLKNFVEEIKTVEVSKVISVAASSVNDATENKYEEKVNAFAGVADTIAGGTLGNFRIRNFLVASAEGSAEQGLAEQIHNILIIYNANNSSVDEMFVQLSEIYGGVRAKEFLDKNKNLEINQSVSATSSVVKTFFKDDANGTKVKDIIDGGVNVVEVVFRGKTFVKFGVADFDVSELTEKTETLSGLILGSSSQANKTICSVLGEFKTLYNGVKVSKFVEFSKDMPLENVINASTRIAKTAVADYSNGANIDFANDTLDDIAAMVNCVFEGSTLGKVKVAEDKYVVEFFNRVEDLTDNFLKDGTAAKTIVAKVYDEIEILYPTSTFNTIVNDSKNMLLANVVNAATDIVKTALTECKVKNAEKINDCITDFADLVNYTLEGSTLTHINIYADKQIVEFVNKVEAITDNFLKDGSKERTVVAEFYNEVKALYAATTLKTFVADSKNMFIADVVNAATGIVKTALTTYNVKNADKINDCITDFVELVNYTLEGSTLTHINIYADKQIVVFVDKVEAITDNFLKEGSKEKTVVAKVYEEVRILYPATTLKSFVTDSKKLIIADVTVAAGEIVKVSVNKQKASDITDAVNDIVKVVFGTKTITDSKPIVNFEVAKLSNEVKDLADIVITNNKAKTIIDEVAAQFASLYAGVVRSEFVTASGELQIADIVDSVDSIIKTCVTVSGNKDEVKINDGIDDLAELAKTLFGGTVKKPVVYNITVSDAADRAEAITDDIPMNTRLRETISCVYEKVRSLYDGKKLTEVGSASKSLEFNAVVSAVSDITVTAAKNNVVTDVFDGVKGISSKLFTGTMSSVKIADFFIDELTDEVIAAADKAIGAGVPKDMFDETAAQFAYLFNGTRRSGFVTAAKNVDFGDLLHSVSEIAKKASTNSKYLSAVTDTVALAGELVSGKVTAPKFADFEITGLANAVNAFVTDFVPDGKVKDVISKTIENFGDLYAGGTTRTTFVADSKNLSIGDTITSVKEITDVAGVKLDRVYTLATVAIGGNDEHASTFAKPYFNMNGLWNEANTTEKIVGVGVGAAAGAGMYFLANDTLVKLAKNALGEDKLVGDLVAETLGYTKNESGKWTFEDDENELATTAFELRVCDVLKKGFDFKGTFEEKLNVANVALLGKAVNTKYDKKDNVKDIVNGALDEIVNLFGTADAKNYKEVIKAVKVDDVVDSLAAIAGIPSSGKYADKADHIAALLKEMLAGTLGKPGIESNMFIAPVVRGVKDVALDYIPDGKVKDIVSVTLENFASLYEYDLAGSTEKASYTFKRIKEGTKAIEIKKLIASGSDIVKTASSAVYGKTERWFDVAGQILAGTVSDPEVYIDKAWKGLSNKEKLVVAGVGGTTAFVAYNYFNDKFVSYLEKHYGDRTVGSLIADNLGYAQNAGGEYVLSAYGFVNPMMNEYFAEKIVTVANKTYDYKQPLREYLTVGNLIAASGQTMHVYTKFAPASFKLAQEGGKWTIEGDKYKTVAENVLAIAAFKDGKRLDARVKDDVKAFIGNEILANVRVGELMGKTKNGTGWLESAGVYASGMSSAVYDIDAGKFVKGETTVDDVVNGLTVGDVMTITNESSGLLQRLKPVKVGDLAGRIDNLRLGEAMSYVRVEDGGTVKWYEAEKDAEGNYVIAEADFVAGTTEITDEVVLAIADFTVKELSDGGFADKLMNAVKDITLGKVISVGNNKILKQLENVKIGNISTEINHMSVSKLLGYEKGADGKWYETDGNGDIDTSKEVTGVVTAFVDFTIGELGSGDFGTKIKAKVNDLALGDVIEPAGNPILAALADKKIGNLATEANELKVGVIMGYTYDETAGVWYKDAAKTAPVTDDLMLMLAKYQVKDLNSVDFESRVTDDIKQLKVSKFFGSYESNANTIFEVLTESDYNNATIESLPGLMKSSLTNATLGKLGDLGIVSLDANNIDTGDGTMVSIRTALNTVFSDQDAAGEYLWENWDMSQLLTKLVQKAFNAASRP